MTEQKVKHFGARYGETIQNMIREWWKSYKNISIQAIILVHHDAAPYLRADVYYTGTETGEPKQ